MRDKKTEVANIEKRKRGFFYIGLIVALSICLIALEWVFSENSLVDTIEPLEIEPVPEVVIVEEKGIPERPKPKPEFNSSEALVFYQDTLMDTAKFVTTDSSGREFQLPDGQLSNFDESEIFIDPFPGVITKNVLDIDQRPHYRECLKDNEYNPLVFDCTVEKIFSYVKSNLTVPKCVKLGGGEQIVHALVVLDETGFTQEVKVLNSDAVCEDCAREAIRVLNSLPPMQPAIYGGMNIRVSFSIPIKFQYR